ncbi:MAG: hypothetical protein PF630_06325 [Gammaproteobacteria bacterium]|nr:hypothetical protein [Gammaproteobacteria bacterium]
MKIANCTLPAYLSISEVSDGKYFGDDIIMRKLAVSVPPFGRHVLAFYKHSSKHITPLGYLHISEYATVALIGGGSVDGSSFCDIPDIHCEEIKQIGGVLFQLLTHVFTYYSDRYEAFFGYCGDARAEEVDLKAGFRRTNHPMLLVNYHKDLAEDRKALLLESVVSLGPNFDGIYDYYNNKSKA